VREKIRGLYVTHGESGARKLLGLSRHLFTAAMYGAPMQRASRHFVTAKVTEVCG